jgi:hypothetical protein
MSANSKLSPADVDKILKSTQSTSARGFDQYFGYGRIDAAKAWLRPSRHDHTYDTTTGHPGADHQHHLADRRQRVGVVPVDVKYSDNVGVTASSSTSTAARSPPTNRARSPSPGIPPATPTVPTSGGQGLRRRRQRRHFCVGLRHARQRHHRARDQQLQRPSSGLTVSVPKQTISASATDNKSRQAEPQHRRQGGRHYHRQLDQLQLEHPQGVQRRAHRHGACVGRGRQYRQQVGHRLQKSLTAASLCRLQRPSGRFFCRLLIGAENLTLLSKTTVPQTLIRVPLVAIRSR